MTTYSCAPGLVWTKEHDHILIVARESGRVWKLRGTEALIWEWLCAGYSYPKLFAVVETLTSESALLPETLQHWLDDHLVEA